MPLPGPLRTIANRTITNTGGPKWEGRIVPFLARSLSRKAPAWACLSARPDHSRFQAPIRAPQLHSLDSDDSGPSGGCLAGYLCL